MRRNCANSALSRVSTTRQQRVLDLVDAVGGLARDALQFVGLIAQQVIQQRGGAGDRLAALDGRAQAVHRAQRAAPRRDHDVRAHADPQRGDVAGLEREIECDVVEHREQRVEHTLDARRARALVQRLVERVVEARVRTQPRFGGGVRQVEVQPHEAAVARRGRQEVGAGQRVDRLGASVAAESKAADQAVGIGAIGGRQRARIGGGQGWAPSRGSGRVAPRIVRGPGDSGVASGRRCTTLSRGAS